MASVQPQSARVVAVVIQYLQPDRVPEMLAVRDRDLTPCPETQALMAEAYRVSDSFSFSPDYLAVRSTSWLGRTELTGIPGLAAVGTVTVNHVLVSNGYHELVALHQHVAIEKPAVLSELPDQSVTEIVRLLHALYWLQERDGTLAPWIRSLDPFHALAATGEDGFFSRRSVYVSLLLPEPSSPSPIDWRPIAPSLYALLNLHGEGVDPAVALETLTAAEYRSTSFFAGFFQFDAALTLARPFPPEGVVPKWPVLIPTTPAESREVLAAWQQRKLVFGRRFEAYDLSPEYPALRYNAMALLEFSGSAAYAEWRIRRELAGLMTLRWCPGLVKSVRASRRVDRLYYRARWLGTLRLPVVREIAGRTVRAQLMEESGRTIDGMRGSLTNSLLAFLAGAALILGLGQIAIAVVTAIDAHESSPKALPVERQPSQRGLPSLQTTPKPAGPAR